MTTTIRLKGKPGAQRTLTADPVVTHPARQREALRPDPEPRPEAKRRPSPKPAKTSANEWSRGFLRTNHKARPMPAPDESTRVSAMKKTLTKAKDHDARVAALVKLAHEHGPDKLRQEIAIHERKIADLNEALEAIGNI